MIRGRAGSTTAVCSRWRLPSVAFCLLAILAGFAGVVSSQDSGAKAPVFRVNIDGMINPGALAMLEHAIEVADAAGAPALILRIDTPGGLLSTTRNMVSAIAESPVPVIGYVGPAGASATSAGAFILLSTHVAIMNTGTNLGASSPVAGDGGDIEGAMGRKIMNDSRAFMRSVADSRGRNADVAERFVSEAHSLSADAALEQNVVDRVVGSPAEILGAASDRIIELGGRTHTLDLAGHGIEPVETRLVDRLLTYIAHPQVAHLLLSLGMLALFMEVLSPGLALPGVFGAIAIVLGLVGMQALPVSTGFLILLLLGMTLMFAEYFVAGLGVLGIGGAIAFVIGSLNLFEGEIDLEYRGSILPVSVAVSAAFLLTSFLVARSLTFGSARRKPMAGKSGEAMVSFEKSGQVLIDDERWPAETLEPLHYGDRIVVVDTDARGCLVVRKADNQKRHSGTP